MHRINLSAWLVVGLLGASVLVTLYPFWLAATNAVKSPADYGANGPIALPQSFDLSGLLRFWHNVDFTLKLFNSALISGAVAAIAVLLSLLSAYAIGIGRIKGSRTVLFIVTMGMMVPQESLVYPLYYIMKSVGLFDTRTSVIIIFAVLQSAYGTYLLSAVLSTFPRELLEAAEIDGASRFEVLVHVVTPLLRPTLMVLATFFFIWTWNEFLLPLVLLISNDNQTVSVAMGTLNTQYTSDPTTTAAASLLGLAPTVLFFLIFQRTLTRGIAVGAVK
ncbi:ABC transporter permease [Ensifer adhaerens]|uniref:ABC transporter permease n=2 Tax=Ensifer adhaerens TaxID=106592 RepID=A0A0L8C7R7_ENSAD|nr:ABC transporter permease [Ensifer adhaerens]